MKVKELQKLLTRMAGNSSAKGFDDFREMEINVYNPKDLCYHPLESILTVHGNKDVVSLCMEKTDEEIPF